MHFDEDVGYHLIEARTTENVKYLSIPISWILLDICVDISVAHEFKPTIYNEYENNYL